MKTFIGKMLLQLIVCGWLVLGLQQITGVMLGWYAPVLLYLLLKVFLHLEKFKVVQKVDGKETVV